MSSPSLFVDPATKTRLEEKEEGFWNPDSGILYPIVRGIPRFVAGKNYTENFGDQWNVFQLTQLDRKTQVSITRERLYRGTEWNPSEIRGKTVLEIGCGAGRFTEQFLNDGAEVWAVDFSSAVEACNRNHGHNPHVHIAQADLFKLPFAENTFDYVFMYGVMQHTPDPRKALEVAISMAKNGGKIAVDCYPSGIRNRWTSKYHWRWLTTRMPPRTLRRFIEWYIPKWIRVDDWLGTHSPDIQRRVASLIPCWNYRGVYPLTERQIVEWAILDTYDALGARYDKPCSRIELAEWLNSIHGIEFSIKRGGIGLEANIVRLQ